MPMEEKNKAANISRTGSNVRMAFSATSRGAVLTKTPAKNAPTSAEFNIFSVTMVMATHIAQTPRRNKSCDGAEWSMASSLGHTREHTATTATVSASFAITWATFWPALDSWSDNIGMSESTAARAMS